MLFLGRRTPFEVSLWKAASHAISTRLRFLTIRGALAHLGVARANALQSRTSQGADADAARVRALAAYKDFLTLWKDADPDIPIFIAAKSEYAKLH